MSEFSKQARLTSRSERSRRWDSFCLSRIPLSPVGKMDVDDHHDLLYLSRKDVEMACQPIDSVAIMRKVFELHGSGQTILPDEAYLQWTNVVGENVRSLNMPGYLGKPFCAAGTKIINSNPHNPSRGIPRASGLTMLFDNDNTRILCVMEAAYISSLRTASVSALAAELFESASINTLAVIGAGALAAAHIDLLAKRLPHLRRVLVFDVENQRIHTLARDLAPVLEPRHIEIEAASSAEDAIRKAQMTVPVTTATTGYIHFEWLQPGSILVNISLDDPLPEVVFKAHKVVVDDWTLVKNDTRRLIGRMFKEGLIIGPDEPVETANGRRKIDAQIGDIVTKTKVGRENPDEIILVNPFGLSIEDVAIAARVFETAKALGIGTMLER